MHQTTEFSGRLVVALLLPALVLYCIMVFGPLAHLTELSQGRRPFDMMPGGYDEPYARAFLDALGTGGRAYYLKRQIPLDFIYPALFAAAFFALCNWLATKIVWSARALRWFGMLPLLAAAFDYAENLLIISILRGYPPVSQSLVGWASLASIAKSGATTLFFCLMIGVLALALVRRLRNGQPDGK